MRTFIAIDVPDPIKEKILSVAQEFKNEGTVLVNKDALHITLLFLGELNEQGVERVKESMRSSISFQAFNAAVKGLDFFTPKFIRVVFAKVVEGYQECVSIYNQITTSLSNEDLAIPDESFVPHITIARVKRVINRQTLLSMIKRYNDIEFGNFQVSSIKLKSSALTRDGPIYNDLYELKP
jgi:2'-5' RNA ligase